jgi:UDP-galactopyranose mutase
MQLNDALKDAEYVVVGAGLSGVVLAERIANVLNKDVIVLEKRDHIAGNCYDYIDEDTNIRISKYGPHLFHTNDDIVWNYINKFAEWIRWDHKVVANIDNKLVNLPININTINTLFNEKITNSSEMTAWLEKNRKSIPENEINTSEDVCLNNVGEVIYEKIFKPYTYKQWAKYPSELKPEVLRRIPLRLNFDDRYFSDKYQALPVNGYTRFVKNILESPRIHVYLNTDFYDIRNLIDTKKTKIFITGPIDQYFKDSGLPKLEYRSINFEIEKHFNTKYYQTHSVVNYPNANIAYTRITEYKHFLNQYSPHTIIIKETSTDIGDPYYPIPDEKNIALYEKYKSLASNISNVYFLGRLGTYKYFNMDAAIKNSLDFFHSTLHLSSF